MNYPTHNTFKDDDMSKDARQSRFGEYQGLKQLPYWSGQQNGRFGALKKLIKRDNRFAFEQSLSSPKLNPLGI